MSKKNFLLSALTIMMVAIFSMSLISCGGDDDPVSAPPVPNDGKEQTDIVSNQDPVGTVVVNMNNGTSNNYVNIGLGCEIHIDAANNFVGYNSNVEFASVGQVSGLGKMTSIPTSGWAKSAAVVPGTGYVARYKSTYTRLYVVERIVNIAGGIIGATVKYQSPFMVPIALNETSLTFSSVASEQTLTLTNRTQVEVVEKPEWCTVTVNENKITVLVTENCMAQQRTGNIVLRNTANSVTVSVVQQASSSPVFQAGSGTAEDPYQIKTAKHLESISKALNAYFVLTADIDLSSYLNANDSGWDPIGKSETPFTGNFDGQGHTIKGLWINRSTTNDVGFFGYVKNATIANIRIEIGQKGINGGSFTGGLCGYIYDSKIQRCSVQGTVTGNEHIGGICGYSSYGSSFSECYTSGAIYAYFPAGILGTGASSTEIFNCYSTADLFSTAKLCYAISNYGKITKCYYAGHVSAATLYFYCDGTYAYYDSSILGLSVSSQSTSNGRTTAQMKTQSNYKGWDFNTIWKITEGSSYPTLRCFDN